MGLEFFVSKEVIPTKEPSERESTTARASLDFQTITNTRETSQKDHMTGRENLYGQAELPLFAVFRKASVSNDNS